MSDSPDCIELWLETPFRFDAGIGYWTGERDADRLTNALLEVAQHQEVARQLRENGVLLSGPREAVLEEARLLRAAGLE